MSRNWKRWTFNLAAACFVMLTLGETALWAAIFNVSNDAELRGSLSAAERNGEDDVINIFTGSYFATGVPFTYDAEEDDVPEENFALSLIGVGGGEVILHGNGVSSALVITTLELKNDRNARITIQNLTITGGEGPGALITVSNSDVHLQSVKFDDNGPSFGALSLSTFTGNINISQCTFTQNLSDFVAGAMLVTDSGDITLLNNIFDDNGETALHIATETGEVLLDGNTLSRNSSVTEAAGAHITTESSDINLLNNFFTNNDAGGPSGGLEASTFIGNIFLMDNFFDDNSGFLTGGASLMNFTNNITGVNNIFFDNEALGGDGGGLFIFTNFGLVTLTNNTISENFDPGNGGGLAVILIEDEAHLRLYNNIIWNNTAALLGSDIFIEDNGNGNNAGSIVDIFNNNFSSLINTCTQTIGCIEQITLSDNLNFNPLFISTATSNLRLSNISALIDQGSPNAPLLPTLDFDGNTRSVQGTADTKDRPDIGAFEFIPLIPFIVAENSGGCSIAGVGSASGILNLALVLLLPAGVYLKRKQAQKKFNREKINKNS